MCVCVYISQLFLWKGPRSKDTPTAMSTLTPQNFVSNTISTKKVLGILGRIRDLRVGKDRYKMSLE